MFEGFEKVRCEERKWLDGLMVKWLKGCSLKHKL